MSVLEGGSGIGWLGPRAGDLTFGPEVTRPGPESSLEARGPVSLAGHQALASGLCAGNGEGWKKHSLLGLAWLPGFRSRDAAGLYVPRMELLDLETVEL